MKKFSSYFENGFFGKPYLTKEMCIRVVENLDKERASFIGPRPERREFVKKLEEKIPYYSLRHSVKPGITGWAQVN